jgi:NAD(P)-dependent dehydrogenase (short-subunit alcohol dehydrogenase family)
MNEPDTLYLGRLVDEQNQLTDQPVEYPLDHLTTHALLLGATGSGKTGLGLALVEETLRHGIPVLLLDVKGDLANLLLTFPDLSPEDFAPWIDADAAQRQGQTPDQAAQAMAERWRTGLAGWGLGPEHIAQLRHKADIALYTPGLRAGRPVDILARFGAPPTGDPDAACCVRKG